MSRWRPRPTIRTLANEAEGAAAAPLWIACLARAADRVAHEIRNPLNGLALNLEVVRSRSERPGVEGSALAPYAAAASGELERTLPLVSALLSLARPSAFPVDLRHALEPLSIVYGAIAKAAGGTLRISNCTEQMFVSTGGTAARTLLADFLDAAVGEPRVVTGELDRQGDRVTLRLSSPLARPIGSDVRRLATSTGARFDSAHGATLLSFPALAPSGADSTP